MRRIELKKWLKLYNETLFKLQSMMRKTEPLRSIEEQERRAEEKKAALRLFMDK